jgi:processive 1,2-diacylglycerol beta-glucosyltransferase
MASGSTPLTRPPFGGKDESDVKILVLGASAGTGHIQAAKAVSAELSSRFPKADIQFEDIVAHISPAHRLAYHQGWETLLKLAPRMVGWTYEAIEQPSASADHPYFDNTRTSKDTHSEVRKILSDIGWLGNQASYGPFIKLLKSKPWDLIVNCHMLGADIVGHYKISRQIHAPQVLVITDFAVHSWWLTSPVVDHYFVANDDCQAYLMACGIAKRKISTTGIPIHPRFAVSQDRAKCAEHLGLWRTAAGSDDNDDANSASDAPSKRKPVVLLMAGGLGLMMDDSFKELLAVRTPIEIVAICGKSEGTRESLQQIADSTVTHHTVHVIGYTTEMDLYMRAADLLVGKPGGLSASEALALDLPLVCNMPLPGQEERNGDWLCENGTAVKAVIPGLLGFKVDSLLSDSKRLARMRRACQRVGTPFAARDVVDQCLSVCESWKYGQAHESPKVQAAAAAHFRRLIREEEVGTASHVLTEGKLFDSRATFLEKNEDKRRYLSKNWVWPDIVSKVCEEGQVWAVEKARGADHDGIVGVALWEPPRSALASGNRMMLSFTTLALSPLVAGIGAVFRLSQVRKLIEDTHIKIMGKKPHWYLVAQASWVFPEPPEDDGGAVLPEVVSDSAASRKVRDEVDREMLTELCRRADADGYPTYCESFDANRMVPLLQSFGFVVRDEVKHPLSMFAMVRDPK